MIKFLLSILLLSTTSTAASIQKFPNVPLRGASTWLIGSVGNGWTISSDPKVWRNDAYTVAVSQLTPSKNGERNAVCSKYSFDATGQKMILRQLKLTVPANFQYSDRLKSKHADRFTLSTGPFICIMTGGSNASKKTIKFSDGFYYPSDIPAIKFKLYEYEGHPAIDIVPR